MIAVERDQIEVDYCIACRGIWFDRGELELLGEKIGTHIDPATILSREATTREAPRKCPKCGKRMLKNELPIKRQVIIDRCPDGEGVWFDAQELGMFVDCVPDVPGHARPVARFLGELFGNSTS